MVGERLSTLGEDHAAGVRYLTGGGVPVTRRQPTGWACKVSVKGRVTQEVCSVGCIWEEQGIGGYAFVRPHPLLLALR